MRCVQAKLSLFTWLVGTLFFLLHGTVASAAPAGPQPPIPIDASQVQFTYESQDGEFVFPCTHQISHPVLQDWDVRCADPLRPETERRFTVHVRVFLFKRATPPATAYQILFEVTNQALPLGAQGRYVGSTMWLRFDNDAPMSSLDLSQEIENTTMLEMRLRLK